jgi:anti-anti-sigma regulatory factor
MLDVHREELPKGYLLVLAPSAQATDEFKLTRALHRASRSAKKAIWVDCSLLDHLSTEAIDLLLAYAYMLHCQQRRLVLCHVPDTVRHHFLDLDAESQPLLVPSLLDAEALSHGSDTEKAA